MAHRRRELALSLVLAIAGIIAGATSTRAAALGATAERQSAFDRWLAGPVQYLLSEKEKEIAAALSSRQHTDAFRRWFWERRDPTPGTLANEFRERFAERVSYADKEYGDRATSIAGCHTPKGVVYILLGPPTRISHRAGKAYGDFASRDVEVWVYEFEDATVLEVPFIAVSIGFALLTTPENVGMHARLDAALRRATMGVIHNRDLPFTGVSPLTSAGPADTWPAVGYARWTDAGLEGQLSVPLTELLGRPQGEDLLVELRLETGSPDGSPLGALGTLRMLLRHEVFERWSDRSLTVALWLPGVVADESAQIVVTEVVSGRAVRLQPASRDEAVAQAYAVEELVDSTRLADGDGAAFAFIGEDAETPNSSSGMWVLRPAERFDGILVEQLAPNLRLVRRR